jgi:hypothetical protein
MHGAEGKTFSVATFKVMIANIRRSARVAATDMEINKEKC